MPYEPLPGQTVGHHPSFKEDPNK